MLTVAQILNSISNEIICKFPKLTKGEFLTGYATGYAPLKVTWQIKPIEVPESQS